MNYEKSIPFQGDFTKAADIAKNTLLPHGFQVLNTYDNSIELEGTRSIMTKGADPLIGISWIHIQKTNGSLILKTELGGISKTAKLMAYIIIPALLLDFVILGIIFSRINLSTQQLLPMLVTFFVLPIVIPFSYIAMKKRTIKSIDTLFSNMVTLSNQ